jgi:hypothetical protein
MYDDTAELYDSDPSIHTMGLGSTQPIIEMSTINPPGGGGGRRRRKGLLARETDLTAICKLTV